MEGLWAKNGLLCTRKSRIPDDEREVVLHLRPSDTLSPLLNSSAAPGAECDPGVLRLCFSNHALRGVGPMTNVSHHQPASLVFSIFVHHNVDTQLVGRF